MPQSEDERRAAARERMRKRRAEQKRDQVSVSRSRANTGRAPRTMRAAVDTSLKAMKWIVPSDSASVAQARLLAKQVDELEHAGQAMRALSAHRALSRVLNDLAATPAARLQHEVRSLRAGADQGGGGDGGNEGESQQSSNVSQFKRPEKRRRS